MPIPKLDYLWQYVDHWAALDVDFPAIRHGEQSISAGELGQTVDQLAQVFLHYGLKKGDRVVTILPSIPQYVLTFCAAAKIGAITVPLDVRYGPADLRRFISHAKPNMVVALSQSKGHDVAATLEELCPDIPCLMVGPTEFGVSFEAALATRLDLDEALEAAKSALDPDDGTLVVFTGGTSGVPKAALLSHRNVVSTVYPEVSYVLQVLASQGVTGRIKTLAALPPSHAGGTVELIGTGIAGGMEMIMQDHWSPHAVLSVTQDARIPWMAGVPTMYAILLSLPDLGRYDLSSLKLAVISGEKVGLELLQGIKTKICDTLVNGYGSTEAGAEVTFTSPADDLAAIADGYVGKALPGQEIKIVDLDDAALPPGEQGEIHVRGPMTIKGYYNMPAENQAGFTPGGWCRTGDLGYLTEDGGLYIKGRKKHIIRVGSYTVLPTEVEEIAVQHPAVALAAAIGVPDKIYGQVVWLAVVPQAGSRVDKDEIIAHCKRALADFKAPNKVLVREDVPMTRLGKVDRIALQNQVRSTLEP